MNTLAWLVGAIARRWARVMLRWAETRYGPHAVRLWMYANVLAGADEPALIGVAGKPRGHRVTVAGTPKRYTLWRHAVAWWTFNRLAERAQITIDGWTPARGPRKVVRMSSR